MSGRLIGVAVAAFACAAGAENQVWNDGGADNVWSTNAANWEAGSVWTNGNKAVFSGTGGTVLGETIDVSNDVVVAGLSFQTNGYVVADSDKNGTLTLSGTPDIEVANASGSAVVSGVLAGASGFNKTGAGRLQLTGTNTFAGVVTVKAGTLRLSDNVPAALGTTGAGNGTVVEDGATLDIYSAYMNNVAEDITIKGFGVGGVGAFVNNGPTPYYNTGYRNLTLAGDASIGGTQRFDMSGTGAYFGNGFTLTKTGSCEVAVNRPVTNSPIIIAAGTYIVQTASAFGGTDYATTLNGGMINLYVKDLSFAEHFYINGGKFRRMGQVGTNTISGALTFGNWSTVEVTDNVTNVLFLTGVLDGTGGFTENGPGSLYVTGTSNTYSGTTVINGPLYLGRPGLYAGSLGSGMVTNNGTVYCYSGRLGSGNFVNNTYLYFDATNSFAVSNNLLGTGISFIRYGGRMTLNGNALSNATFRLGKGSLTLTNGATFYIGSELSVADRYSSNYPVDPTNVTATLTVANGCSLTAQAFIIGNGNTVDNGGMTGVVNQIGGTVRTFGWNGDPVNFPGERDGLRIAHFKQANGTYNMMGGTLMIDNGYRLTVATDGTGYFHQTGGEVFTPQLIVNDRSGGEGYGHLLLEGGVLNVGSNGITAGTGAPYLAEYGGAGGVVRAGTNFASSVSATLLGSGTNAVTFDTTNWTITLSGKLSGTGGLNKAGSGTLVMSGTNTYAGGTRILAGTVQLAATCIGPTGTVAFAVSTNGVGGVLAVPDGFSLAGMTVAVANPEALDTGRNYTIASWSGNLAAPFGASALPGSWYVYYDWAGKTAQLRTAIGTVIRVR